MATHWNLKWEINRDRSGINNCVIVIHGGRHEAKRQDECKRRTKKMVSLQKSYYFAINLDY